MSEMVIQSERLRLILQTPVEVLAQIEALSPADRAEVSPAWLAQVRASTSADPWLHGYSIVDKDSGAVIGRCGYKGAPDPQGVVEIAYAVEPAYRGRGYATEAAMALVDFAFGNDSVRLIRAHTLPDNGASAQILRKCEFTHIGEVVDDEDGLVWRWERTRQPA